MLLAIPLALWGAWEQLLAWAVFLRLDYNDFGRFYYAVVNWRAGGSLYGPTVATWFQFDGAHGMHLWNLNPPHVSLLIWPLTWIPIGAAFQVWFWINVVAFILAAEWTRRELHAHVSGAQFCLFAAFVVAATPTISTIETGQLTGLLTLLTTRIWLETRQGRWTAVGALLGVAWSVKLFYVPLLCWLVLTGRRRAAAVSVATGLALFTLGAAVFGWREELAWFGVLRGVQWPWLPMNASIVAPFVRGAFVIAPFDASSAIAHVAMAIGVTCAVLVLVAGVWRAVCANNVDRALLVLLVTCLLAFPVCWLYYWWIIGAPLIACWRVSAVRRAFWLSLPGWLIGGWFIWPPSTVLFAVTIGSLYCWTFFGLWVGAIRATTED